MPAENALVGEKSTVQDNQCEEQRRTKKNKKENVKSIIFIALLMYTDKNTKR
jgi:hypothetical protein